VLVLLCVAGVVVRWDVPVEAVVEGSLSSMQVDVASISVIPLGLCRFVGFAYWFVFASVLLQYMFGLIEHKRLCG
jgi:hypothetical protein